MLLDMKNDRSFRCLRRNRTLLVLGFLGSSLILPTTQADDYPRQPQIDVQHYTFDLTLSDDTDVIQGRTAVRIRFLKVGQTSFQLDLLQPTAEQLAAETPDYKGMIVDRIYRPDESAIEFTHADHRIDVQLNSPIAREEEIRTFYVEYHGIPDDGLVISKNSHGKRTFFSDNFPNRTRHYLATVDHPADKATSRFNVTVPSHYNVVSNGSRVKTTALTDETSVHLWQSNVPLPTYLMVIGVADFTVRQEEPFDEIPISTWVYQGDEENGLDDFALTPAALKFLTENVGPYPFAKLANVESNTRWGGMENASCIFYPERSVAGTGSMDGVTVHEIAHQWFGDSATEADWNHVWLSEGFATYFTHLFFEATVGRERLVSGLTRDRTRIIQYENRRPGVAVVDPNVPIEGILSTLTYQKGGWFLHMLRCEIGDENFWKGIRSYYDKYKFANALSDDLRVEMEAASGEDLEWLFDQWLETAGHPIIAGDWSYDANTKLITIYVQQTQSARTVFRLPLEIKISHAEDAGAEPSVHEFVVDERREVFTIAAKIAPTEITLDPNTRVLFDDQFNK